MENIEEKNLPLSQEQAEAQVEDELSAEEEDAVAGGGIIGAALGGAVGGAVGFITTGTLDGAKAGAAGGIAVGGFLPEP
ncbi:hypothetical protein [Scytonema sp. NUACC26]|uniref:hypothetical protein n=1 Tax=Scytonema sp. NUACC26 TaxID=3140176 RepID=UPI0034DCB632